MSSMEEQLAINILEVLVQHKFSDAASICTQAVAPAKMCDASKRTESGGAYGRLQRMTIFCMHHDIQCKCIGACTLHW